MPIWLERGSNDKMINWFRNRQFLDILSGDEFGSSETFGLSFLSIGGREHNDFTTHFCGELDCKMTESTDSDYTDTFVWFDTSVERAECVVDGCTTAHKRSGIFGGNALWDLVD